MPFSPGNRIISLGGLNFGDNPAYIHSLASHTINSPIAGTGGLIVSGGGVVTLAAAKTFTGSVTLNGGVIRFANDAAFGAPSNGIVLNSAPAGAGIASGLFFTRSPQFIPTPNTSLTTTRPITVGPGGGALGAVQVDNSHWTVAGPISGSGPLTLSGGLISLTGVNAGFTGSTSVFGSLAIDSDAALGGPAARLFLNGTLRLDGSFATSRNVNLGGSIVLPAGRTLQLDGACAAVSGLGLVGPGDLVMTATNTFNSFVSIGDVDPVARLAVPVGTPTGPTLTLRGPNGALPLFATNLVPQVRISQNGMLHLDNSGPTSNANANRLGAVGINLSGGELKLTGNANVDVSEFVGASTQPGGLIADRLLGTVTLVQPDSGGAGRQTTLAATSYTLGSNVAVLEHIGFVRGTNLGATTGDRTALLLNSNPSSINGLIQAMVLATSATSAPTDFATAIPVGTQYSVNRFTAYAGPTPASGGAVANTYDNTALQTVTENLAGNALRLSAGGGMQISPGATVTMSSGMLLALPGNVGIRGGTINSSTDIFSG